MEFEQLEAKLAEVGIECSPTTAEGTAFLLDLDWERTELKIHIGEAKVKCYPCSESRQAVITVEEKNRQFDQSVETTIYRKDLQGKPYLSVSLKPGMTTGVDKALTRLGVDRTIFDGIGLDVHSPDTKKFVGRITRDRKILTFSGTFFYEMANSKTSFLVGYDESHLFVSQLPKVATSVAAAHKMLKPTGLAEGWKRQGEWFFSPLSDKEAEKVVSKMDMYDTELEGYLTNTDHLADIVFTLDGKQYAFGKISGGDRHKTLLLTRLHRVIRNNEIVSASNSWD